jgi:membrane-associated phospholipid phosphatase
MHFLSDVLAGGVIGSVLGFVSFHLAVALFPGF